MNEALLLDTLKALYEKVDSLDHHRNLRTLQKLTKIETHPHRKQLEHLDAQLSKALYLGRAMPNKHKVVDSITGQTEFMSYNIPFEKMTQIIRQYEAYMWLALHCKMKVKLAAKDVPLLTVPSIGLERNKIIGKWMPTDCIVVDMGAGSGTDTISFFNHMFPKKVYAIEDSSDVARNIRLRENVTSFLDAFHLSHDLVQIRFDGYQQFLRGGEVEKIDLLYIDPPWVLGKSQKEATPAEIVHFVHDSIIKPMKESGVDVRMICLKLRYPWEQCSEILTRINEGIERDQERYRRIDQLNATPFNQQFSFHFMIRNVPFVHEFVADPVFNYVYKGIELPVGYQKEMAAELEPVYDKNYYMKKAGEVQTRLAKQLPKGKSKGPPKEVEVKEEIINDDDGELIDSDFHQLLTLHKLKQGRKK